MMKKYRGLFTFDTDNHSYVPLVSANEIIDLMDTDDYVPDDSLIKDNKLKEIFRDWSKVIGIDEKTTFKVTHHNQNHNQHITTLFQSDDESLFTIELPGRFGNYNGKYTSERIIGDDKCES